MNLSRQPLILYHRLELQFRSWTVNISSFSSHHLIKAISTNLYTLEFKWGECGALWELHMVHSRSAGSFNIYFLFFILFFKKASHVVLPLRRRRRSVGSNYKSLLRIVEGERGGWGEAGCYCEGIIRLSVTMKQGGGRRKEGRGAPHPIRNTGIDCYRK